MGNTGAIRRWLESDYSDIQILASKQGEGAVDVGVSEEGAEIGRFYIEIKTDCGGNSRIQALVRLIPLACFNEHRLAVIICFLGHV